MARRSSKVKETIEEPIKEINVEPISEEVEPEVEEKVPEEKIYTVVCDGFLRVRRGPSVEEAIVDMIEGNKGNKVTVIEVNGKWGKIGPNRWVMMDFLTE